MDENQFEDIPHVFTPPVAKRPRRPLPKRTLLLFAIVGLIVIAFIFSKIGGSKKQNTPSPTPTFTTSETSTETPTETPTPQESTSPSPSSTPKPSVNPFDQETGLDRSKLAIKIENGSGQDGVAGKASDYLTGLGYKISSTSNADNFDYANVTIHIKSSSSDFLDLLKKDLGFNYTVGTASADLSSSASEDALVIIGK